MHRLIACMVETPLRLDWQNDTVEIEPSDHDLYGGWWKWLGEGGLDADVSLSLRPGHALE
jgi:hypothetical protein